MGATQKPSRRHHYVPQHSLRRFVNEDGKLWTYDLIEKNIFAANPKDVGLVGDLYSTTGAGGETDFDRVEKLLADRVDGPGDAAIRRLLNHENLGNDFDGFLRYVAAQIVRTPSQLAHMSGIAKPLFQESAARLASHNTNFREKVRSKIMGDGGTERDVDTILQSLSDGSVSTVPTNDFLVSQAFMLIDKFTEMLMQMNSFQVGYLRVLQRR